MLTGAVCYALTAAGLVLAGLHGWRRRWRTATRWAGVALLPAGLYLTGLIPVGTTIGRALGNWAARLVLDPGVWTGIALLGLAALLLAITGVGRKPKAGGGEQQSAPAAPAAQSRPAVAPSRPARGAAEDLGDFSDIEEILRKRGI
ncbi:hypothetical protein [Kitasatospora viridis]|uniref:Cellulose synthase n=1 Tax=Kitasatospora viridis TaxID=281105 RepID=A0A561UAM5_9ACTN|nr:hypothetical protein [Kitasatospora viridis]TWF96405.1 hypothetical protein FHX73_11172 [Kitasatospora viridis]